MKAKLHKMESGYILSLNGDIDDPYAIVNKELAEDYRWYKLSLRNCQAIELGYDLDGLAENYRNKGDFSSLHYFKEGFQKALEILGDKKFSMNEVVELCKILMSNPFEKCGKTYQELTDSYIQSLQPTEWGVEIEMEKIILPFGANQFINEYKPKLDKNGCLILKTFKP
jgi:hypothetical protein